MAKKKTQPRRVIGTYLVQSVSDLHEFLVCCASSPNWTKIHSAFLSSLPARASVGAILKETISNISMLHLYASLG